MRVSVAQIAKLLRKKSKQTHSFQWNGRGQAYPIAIALPLYFNRRVAAARKLKFVSVVVDR